MAVDGVDLPLLLVIAGFVLMVLEALAPGAHFVVLGVALLAAGLFGMLVSSLGVVSGAGLVLALAGATMLFGAAALFVYREFEFYEGTDAGQTSDSDSLRGRTGRVVERVTQTEGQVKLSEGGFNPYYQARSVEGELEEGEEVLVIDPGGGNVLTVASAERLGADEIDRELDRLERTREENDGGGDPGRAGGRSDAGNNQEPNETDGEREAETDRAD